MPRFNRAHRGLFGNRMIQFGNKISFAENKSRRTWKPNVQVTSLYSETLGRKLRFRVTTHALRCIRKAGGLDEYLMKTKESEIKYPRALKIKEEILAIRAAQTPIASEAAITDLPSSEEVAEEQEKQKFPTAAAQGKFTAGALHRTVRTKQGCAGLRDVLTI